MYLYPDGLSAIAAQHVDDMIADARHYQLVRSARRARRHGAARRASGAHEAGAAHHRADLPEGTGTVAGASHRPGRPLAGGVGRQGGAGTPATADRWARIDAGTETVTEAERRSRRWARLDRDEAAVRREALFAGRTAALAAIAAMSVQPSNLAPCGAREVGRVR